MKPSDLNTHAQVNAAAKAVNEARVVTFMALKEFRPTDRMLHEFVDGKLYALESSYWKRAEALTNPKRRARRKR